MQRNRKSGAPRDEIKITPEMIEAGVDAYYGIASDGWDNPGNAALRAMVREIFTAMSRRRRGHA
jgi:hypothetical protein